MRKSTFILISVLMLLTQACIPNLPAPTQDLNFLGTAIMSTMISGATQTAAANITPTSLISPSPISPSPEISPSPLATSTPEAPSATPSVTPSPTPIFTATSTVPQISVSVATNCRVGPGRVYDRVGALLVGQVAEVVGRNQNGDYWYIRNPNNSNGFCWLWGEYATVSGNFAALPVFTPPPTPTPMPAFEPEYDGLEACTGTGWWVDINLLNTGGITFESLSVTVRDRDTGEVTALFTDSFTNVNGCSGSGSRDRLNPGEDRTVSSAAFTYNPSGHDMRAIITLCARDGMSGNCITEVIDFEP